ncbi:hypothetical protein [Paracoccus sp. (in: a-proteobacteria)]|uniref:hypothetical protein n=1 Tax=Paracoccus sp. TaxID=267 RepID=UPI0026E0C7E0|nr:hypothetical protein [Paracoccus sp. (in: a-proteobacteria)]MDO5370843.1 hypothetical protein [Paracoccus sp. (in: a-proteobacteria)]
MSRLFMFILMIAAPVLAGVGVIIMLALGYYDWRAMLSAAVVGAIAGFPVAWLVARSIQATDPKDSL